VFGVSTPILYSNIYILEANGITTPPKTFDEVRDYAKRLTNDDHYGIYINFEQPGLWMIQSLIENYGELMLSPDRKSVGFDRAGLKAFEFLNNLVNVDKSMPLPDGTEQGVLRAQELFNAGKIAMYITTTGRLGSLQRDAQNTVLTSRFPSEDGQFLSVPGGGNCLFITTQDPKKQEAAWELIKYISAPEQATRVAQVFGYMVISQKAFNTPELMGNFLAGNPAAKTSYNQVPYMTKWCSFPGSSGTKYVRLTLDNISAMFQKEKTPEQAIRDTAMQMNEIIRTGH
jgi:ABC-type glycerol-3-phosphate transport system substrate-binding protein